MVGAKTAFIISPMVHTTTTAANCHGVRANALRKKPTPSTTPLAIITRSRRQCATSEEKGSCSTVIISPLMAMMRPYCFASMPSWPRYSGKVEATCMNDSPTSTMPAQNASMVPSREMTPSAARQPTRSTTAPSSPAAEAGCVSRTITSRITA